MFTTALKRAGLALACLILLGATAPQDRVDINRATVAELMQVQGMTEVWAKRIVRFRPYNTKLDLVRKGVITDEDYKVIRDGVIAHRIDPAKRIPASHSSDY